MEIRGEGSEADASEVLAELLQIIALPHYVPSLDVSEATAMGSDRIRLVFTHGSRPGNVYVWECEITDASDLAQRLQERIESAGGLSRKRSDEPIRITA